MWHCTACDTALDVTHVHALLHVTLAVLPVRHGPKPAYALPPCASGVTTRHIVPLVQHPPHDKQIHVTFGHVQVNAVVLDLSHVSAMDVSGLEVMEEQLRKLRKGNKLLVSRLGCSRVQQGVEY